MNVVCIVLDTVRPDCLGVAGHPVCQTPFLDRFAASGVRFTNAYAEFPLTVPFRTAMVTGAFTFPHRPWTALRPYEPHVAEILRDAGWRTAAFSDTPMRAEVNLDRGFEEFHERPGKLHAPPGVRVPPVDDRGAYFPPGADADRERWDRVLRGWLDAFPAVHGGRIGIELIVDDAIDWLRGARDDQRPFLLWVDSFQAHEPWVPAPRWAAAYDNPDYRGRYLPLPHGPHMGWLEPGEIDHIRRLYWGEISSADEHVGRLLDAVDELDLAEDTLVVVVSDHGVPLGEHGQIRKTGIPLYDEMAKVVWMMRHPSMPAGVVSDALVQTPDMLPTLLEATGIPFDAPRFWGEGPETPSGINGASLLPLATGRVSQVHDAAFFGAFGLHAAVRMGHLKFIDNRGERPNELYDLATDPGETSNLLGEHPEEGVRLHRKLWMFQRRWARALRA